MNEMIIAEHMFSAVVTVTATENRAVRKETKFKCLRVGGIQMAY